MTFLGVIFTVVYISRICHFLFFCSIWPNDLEHVSHVVLYIGTIFTKLQVGQPIRSWLITFSLLWPWPWPLTVNVC